MDELKKAKKGDNVLFVSSNDLKIKDNFNDTFDNVVFIGEKENFDEVISLINGKVFSKIYLLGLDEFYRYMLPRLSKNTDVCWIYKNSFSDLSNGGTRYTLNSIFEFLERDLVSSIGCFSKDNYEVFSNAGYKCEMIDVKIEDEISDSFESNSIGILSNDFDSNNNFYNQLATLTFVSYGVCKCMYVMRATKNFINDFGLKCQKCDDINEVMKNNFVNLYVNFTNTDDFLIKKSFNMGVPIIVGNTNFFDDNDYLKEHLVLKSDDDVNEMVEKIEFVRENRDKILDEYRKINGGLGEE